MARFKKWFKLDNAAKLYPAVATSRWTSAYRVSAELYEPVQPALLRRAVDRVLPRFPALKVRMRSGLFWYYLEEVPYPLSVCEDAGHACMPFRKYQNHGYLMRIFNYRNRNTAEFFHALTDGTGAMVFIKTLATEYLRLLGHEVAFDHGALNPADAPSPAETQDTFTHMPLPRVRVSRKEERAYHFPATAEIPHTLHIIAASIPCDALLAKARGLEVTLTEYLTGVMIFAGCQAQKQLPERKWRPVRVSVPVNMRAFYPTQTLRNFSSFINPGVDPRLCDYSFEQIVHEVHDFMRYRLRDPLLRAAIATNVADEQSIFIRLAPLPLKNFVISQVFRRAGDQLVTTTLTNLGRQEAPTGTEKLIRRFEFQLGAPPTPICNAAAVSYGNELRLVFSSNIRETTLPRETLRFLVAQGIPVEVESNYEEE